MHANIRRVVLPVSDCSRLQGRNDERQTTADRADAGIPAFTTHLTLPGTPAFENKRVKEIVLPHKTFK